MSFVKSFSPLRSQLSGLRFWAIFQSLNKGGLPNFSGSTFRGVFGHSLKAVSCTMFHKNCKDCQIQSSCPYFQTFECEDVALKNQGFQFKPVPYCFHSLPEVNKLEPGSFFSLGITLIGEFAASRLPYFLFALQNLQKFPIGKDNLTIKLVLLKDGNQEIEFPCNLPNGFGTIPEELEPSETEFIIHFKSPLRLVYQGKEQKYLNSENLASAIKNRYRNIHEFHGTFASEDLEHIGNIEIETQSLKTVSHVRYSNKQNRKHSLNGIQGSFRIISDSYQTYRLFKKLEPYHLGKSASFGFGQYQVRKIP